MKKLIYGYAQGSFVFITRTRAEDYVQIYELVRTPGKTWGELRRCLPRLSEHFENYSEVPDDELLSETIPIGTYWPFPHSEQIKLLPSDVVALGRVDDTGDGDRLYLEEADEAEILKRLRAHGYDVQRDDALARAACETPAG